MPVCSSGNYVVCDGAGNVADIELTPEGFEVIEDRGDGYITHTNHFLCGRQACRANHQVSVPDSFPRLDRIRQLVERRRVIPGAEREFCDVGPHEAAPDPEATLSR